MDKLNFTHVYMKLGRIIGYSYVIKDPELRKLAMDVDKELDKAMGWDDKSMKKSQKELDDSRGGEHI